MCRAAGVVARDFVLWCEARLARMMSTAETSWAGRMSVIDLRVRPTCGPNCPRITEKDFLLPRLIAR
jgi:hypothetical protein